LSTGQQPRPSRETCRGAMDALRQGIYAAIDIGSNTVHLLVARSDGYSLEALDDTSKLVGLGVDLEQSGALGPRRLGAAATATRTYVRRAHVAGARRVLVLATQAVRAAANRAEAVAVIEAACGERVLVLEPEREAALAVLAMRLHHGGA